MKNRKLMMPIMALLLIFAIAPVASAHVTVHPEESSVNAWDKYSVRIPVEKDTHTTKVELKVPEGLNLVSVMPVDSWNYELEQDANENITGVTWTATDDGIGPNEFAEFYFIVANPGEAGEFSWDAYQTYEDGSVVEWVGAPDADEPASVTKVVDGGAVAQHGDHGESTSETSNEKSASNESQVASGTMNWLPVVLSVAAILLALISLFRKRA